VSNRVALAALCLLATACATLHPVCEPKVVYTEVKVPVPIPCPVPPIVAPPDFWLPRLDPETAPFQEILQAISHDVAELRRYASELATILEGYQPAPGPG